MNKMLTQFSQKKYECNYTSHTELEGVATVENRLAPSQKNPQKNKKIIQGYNGHVTCDT